MSHERETSSSRGPSYLTACLCLLVAACSDAYAQPRGGGGAEAGAPNADGGARDSGARDGGTRDGGRTTPPTDTAAGDVDAAAPSATTPDASTPVDAGAPAPASTTTDGGAPKSNSDLFDDLLEGRCATAICWEIGGQKNWLGIEPLVELPIGKSFTFNTGGVADYINNHDVQIQFTAGLRVWVLRDMVSLSLYLSQPLTPRDSFVRIPGSSFEYPASYLRRPYPGIALGFLFDTLWLGLDRDELRNGDTDSGSARDPSFPRNAVVSSAWTWTVAIQPFTAFRTGIGTVVTKKAEDKKNEELKKKDEELKKKDEELAKKDEQIRALSDAGAPR